MRGMSSRAGALSLALTAGLAASAAGQSFRVSDKTAPKQRFAEETTNFLGAELSIGVTGGTDFDLNTSSGLLAMAVPVYFAFTPFPQTGGGSVNGVLVRPAFFLAYPVDATDGPDTYGGVSVDLAFFANRFKKRADGTVSGPGYFLGFSLLFAESSSVGLTFGVNSFKFNATSQKWRRSCATFFIAEAASSAGVGTSWCF